MEIIINLSQEIIYNVKIPLSLSTLVVGKTDDKLK